MPLFLFCAEYISIAFFVVPPQIHPFSFDESVNSGDYVTVTCAATKGDIPINITWTLNGLRITMFEGVTVTSMNQRSNQLTIESVQAHLSGEYTCSAKNLVGEVKHSSYLNINGTFIVDILVLNVSPYLFLTPYQVVVNFSPATTFTS